MERTFDELLGKLSIEEKIAQMLVFGIAGTLVDSWLLNFVRSYGLGGLRITPVGRRKFFRYLPEGSKGAENVSRDPQWGEKFIDNSVLAPFYSPSAYAGWLNDFRARAFDRTGAPMHVVTDCESQGGNYPPPGLMNMPHAMGFGDANALELLERGWQGMAEQLKAIGIDWIHSPVVDVNVNPLNTEISARSFGANANLVTRCAAANLRGLKAGNVIGTLKHFPGRGDSAQDAHFGLPVINASREDMVNIHIKPYRELIRAGLAESVMLAHTVFPKIDASEEIATVSEVLIKELLRGELGFQGVIITDSMTMGGLMARYSVSEAAIRCINFGVDLILLKDDNALRGELFRDLVNSVRSGRIPEERIDESVLRLWKVKASHGLFERGGVVDAQAADQTVAAPKYRKLSREMSQAVLRTVRVEEGLLPLNVNQRILLIDRVTPFQQVHNNHLDYPGMMLDILRKYAPDVTLCEYNAQTTDEALKVAKRFQDVYDVIIVTTEFDRSEVESNTRRLVADLTALGKPVIQISPNPYAELAIPMESRNVIVSYGLFHEQFEEVAALLFGKR